MSRLLWRDAQGLDGTVELATGEVLVGRALECAVRTEDAMVSRHHARVFHQQGQYVIEDLGSSNGVFFQEQRVSRHALQHGDAVRCGSLWLRFVDPRQLKPAAAAERVAAAPAPAPAGPPMAPPPIQGPEPQPAARAATPARAARPTGSDGRVAHAVHADKTPGAHTIDTDDLARLRRRVEQLQTELRLYRGSGESARTMESLEEEVARVTEDRDRHRARVAELEARMAAEGGDAKVRKAGEIAQSAAEVVAGLNDVLSNLRINVMAAEGEFERFAAALPRPSFELIREALRSSAGDVEAARDLIRKLRGLS